MSTQHTTAYVLVKDFGRSFTGADFGQGIDRLVVFASKAEAMKELNRWLEITQNAFKNSQSDLEELYNDHLEQLDKDDHQPSFEAWLASSKYAAGAGWYNQNGDFIAAIDSEVFDFGDYCYSVFEAQAPAPGWSLIDQATTLSFHNYDPIEIDRLGKAVI